MLRRRYCASFFSPYYSANSTGWTHCVTFSAEGVRYACGQRLRGRQGEGLGHRVGDACQGAYNSYVQFFVIELTSGWLKRHLTSRSKRQERLVQSTVPGRAWGRSRQGHSLDPFLRRLALRVSPSGVWARLHFAWIQLPDALVPRLWKAIRARSRVCGLTSSTSWPEVSTAMRWRGVPWANSRSVCKPSGTQSKPLQTWSESSWGNIARGVVGERPLSLLKWGIFPSVPHAFGQDCESSADENQTMFDLIASLYPDSATISWKHHWECKPRPTSRFY